MMPSKLVRIVLDKRNNNFIIEYGEWRTPGLSQAQQEEMNRLNEELIGYSDFGPAEALESKERQQLMEKKKRLTELSELEVMEHIDWYPIEKDLIESLLIVVSKGNIHTYVENLPRYLLDRILDPKGNVTINIGSEIAKTGGFITPEDEKTENGFPEEEDDPALEGRTQKELAVIGVMLPGTPKWDDLVKVEEKEDGLVHVTPHKFLGDLWGPINRPLKAVYGQKVWVSFGKGDVGAHWECKVK